MEAEKKKYHSESEKRLVEDIISVDLKSAEQELDKRIVVQHCDSYTGIECFNAFTKKVLVRDDNGKRVVINNIEEIKKQKKFNALNERKNNPSTIQINKNDNDDVDFED